MSAAAQLAICQRPEPLRCEIIKGGLIDNVPEFTCGEQATCRSLLDGWLMCEGCAESMPYLWPERMN